MLPARDRAVIVVKSTPMSGPSASGWKTARTGVEEPMAKTEKSELLDLLRKRQKAAGGGEIDVKAIREEWIESVAALLSELEEWLGPIESQNLAKVWREKLQISESALGAYDLEQLVVEFPGNEVLMVRPVGRMIIGGSGRVDLIVGPRNVMLVRDKHGKWNVGRRAPKLTLVPLSRKLFESVIRDLLRGE